MTFIPALLPSMIEAIANIIEKNAEEVTALDQAIGDGDHVFNLQRGIDALMAQHDELSRLDWVAAFQKIGMTLMSSVGGASGSLYGTLFITLSKAAREQPLNLQSFADIFTQGVDAVKRRGKAEAGEKTLLDVLIPVADYLRTAATDSVALPEVLENIARVAVAGMESTRDMLATKGRASYMQERTRGHIDAGAKTSQLMICAIVDVLSKKLTAPA
ncbi:MAG: dihydroxyacetone kinase subunit DhaL [Methylococcales bacterium]|nr:dihydroxyacetone kinase subunit DhaL [Methylococcales bacterium]